MAGIADKIVKEVSKAINKPSLTMTSNRGTKLVKPSAEKSSFNLFGGIRDNQLLDAVNESEGRTARKQRGIFNERFEKAKRLKIKAATSYVAGQKGI